MSDKTTSAFAYDTPDRAGPDDRRLLAGAGWATALSQYARATGLAVALYDAEGRLHAGPFTSTPLLDQLAAAGGWLPGGHCIATDTDAARAAISQNAVVRRRGFGVFPVIAVPVRLEDRPVAAVVCGWAFDTFPDPVLTDRLSKILHIPFMPFWQIVRQQPPVSLEKLEVYVELLHTLADTLTRSRAETVQAEFLAHDLAILNRAGERLAAAASVADIVDAVLPAAVSLARAAQGRCRIAQPDGRWVVAGEHRLPQSEDGAAPAPAFKVGVRIPVGGAPGAPYAELELDAPRAPASAMDALKWLTSQAAVAWEKVRLIEDLKQRTTLLERLSRGKDEFLAVLSHELRTPLTPIMGWAAILKQQLASTGDESTRRALEAIERNAQQELRLVDDMLDLSRILNQKVHLRLTTVSPADVLAQAVAFAQTLVDRAGQRLEVHAEPDLPPLFADPKRLHQVLANLLSNAVKFTPSDGIIRLQVQREGSAIQFLVSDTGIGIDPEFLPYVFDRFQQENSQYSRKHDGLGIGLSIVRGLVELHGGRVWAESEGRGRGARFVVELPVARDEVRAALTDASERAKEREREAGGGSVLLVDNDVDCLDVLAAMLAPAGFEVRVARNVAEAVRQVEERPPDVVVTDIGMPEEDGFVLLQRLRGRPSLPRVPVVAVTGYAGEKQREEVLAAGFAAHVTKPVDSAVLIPLLAELCRGVDPVNPRRS